MIQGLAEIILEPLIKVTFYGIGWLFLKIISFGQIKIRPLGYKKSLKKGEIKHKETAGQVKTTYLTEGTAMLTGALIIIALIVGAYLLYK